MYAQLVIEERGGSDPGTPETLIAPPHPRSGSAGTQTRDEASSVPATLAAVLVREDAAEEAGTVSPFERMTCRVHRRWIHQCVASPLHVIPITGHRWCSHCQTAAGIAVDELTWTVTVRCPRCRRVPPGLATRQLVRTCQASLAAAACASTRSTDPIGGDR